MSKLKARFDLLKKVYQKWIVEYHGVIPMAILKQYAHKFFHENSNISQYSVRYYNPHESKEYNEWLKLQDYEKGTDSNGDVTFLKEENHPVLDVSSVKSRYVCIVGEGIQIYPEWEAYVHHCEKYDLLYFDHDSVIDGKRCEPVLKPDFSYNTLRGFNYIGRCFVVKTELLKQFNGEKWNIYRWLLELSDQNIHFGHVQKILYADNDYYKEESSTVIDYFRDHAIQAEVTVNEDHISHTVWYKTDEPLVSIIIPTKDCKNVLETGRTHYARRTRRQRTC